MCTGSVKQKIALLVSYLDSLDSTLTKEAPPSRQVSAQISFPGLRSDISPSDSSVSGHQTWGEGQLQVCVQKQALELTHTENKIYILQSPLSILAHHCRWAQEAALSPQALHSRDARPMLPHMPTAAPTWQLKSKAERPKTSETWDFILYLYNIS